jgi:hypothetical protein
MANLHDTCLTDTCAVKTNLKTPMVCRQEHQGFPGAPPPGLQPDSGTVVVTVIVAAAGAAVPSVRPRAGHQAKAGNLHPQEEPGAPQPPPRRDGVPPRRVRAARDEPAPADPAPGHPRRAGLRGRHGGRARRGGDPLLVHAAWVGAPPDRARGAGLGCRRVLRQARAAARAGVPRVQGGARGELARGGVRAQQHRGAGALGGQQPRVVGDEEGVHGPAERHSQRQEVRRGAQGGKGAPQEQHGAGVPPSPPWRRGRETLIKALMLGC